MSYVTVIWSVIASSSLLLALMYGCVWLIDHKARAALAFSFEALAIVGSVIVELGMMHATSPQEWGEWVRWNQVPVLLRTAALVAFIRLYFGTGRSWLMAAAIGSRAIIMVSGFILEPNFNFSRIDSIGQSQFLGEQITIIGRAVTSPYQWFATLSAVLVLVFVADACVTLWRQGSEGAKRKVIVIGGAAFMTWGIGVAYTQFMVYQQVKLPVMLSPPYFLMLVAMTIELSRDTLRASRYARELRTSESRLELAASAAGLGLWTWDAQSRDLFATGRVLSMLGMPRGERVDLDQVRRRVEAADMPRIEKTWRDAMASGNESEVHFRVKLPDGTTRLLAATGRAENDAHGKTLTVQGVVRDVTEQIRTREENEELRRDLAHAGRVSMLGTLSSSLAHELSQPLGAILLNTEAAELMLQRPNPDLEEIRQILADIRRDDSRAAEVIESLRKLLKRGQMDLAPISAEVLVKDVVALLKSDAITRHVTLECRTDPDLPMIRGDRVHLSQVLINLIMNGMDAVADLPQPMRKVQVHARAMGSGYVELVVSDSGAGVDPQHIGRIFEPFFTTKKNGMGMGLSVSRTIVQAHGGKLSAEGGAGAGATFSVALPAVC